MKYNIYDSLNASKDEVMALKLEYRNLEGIIFELWQITYLTFIILV